MSDQKICPTCGSEFPLSERFCPRDGTALRAPNSAGDLVGSVVAERYHVIRKLGEGGMGQVYLAEHVKMGRKSALKVMNPGMTQDADAIARFNREASNASRLNHPNICAIYDFGETPDGLIYLAMEFVEGEPLSSLVERTGFLAPARVASIIHQACDALQVAHDVGIVHRDIKPDNIMVARGRDGGDLVKVVDFGIARAGGSEAQKVTKTGLVVGTPEYMSPEQLAGDSLDGRSDTYSLGLVAFTCLTGTLPFPAKTVQEAMILRLTDRPRTLAEMRPDVPWPATLQAVLDRALARDAAERYQRAEQFGRELAGAMGGLPATQAAQAGTLVIDATMPPTRVATPAAAAASAAPTASAAPSRTGLYAGIGGAAVIGVAAFMLLRGGGATGAPPADGVRGDSTATAASVAAVAPAPTPSVGTATTAAPPAPGRGAPAAGLGGAPTPSVTPAAGAPRSEGMDLEATLTRIGRLTDSRSASPVTARQAVAEVESLLPTLSGQQKARALYHQGEGYLLLDDPASACRVLRQGRGMATGTLKNQIDVYFSSDGPCH